MYAWDLKKDLVIHDISFQTPQPVEQWRKNIDREEGHHRSSALYNRSRPKGWCLFSRVQFCYSKNEWASGSKPTQGRKECFSSQFNFAKHFFNYSDSSGIDNIISGVCRSLPCVSLSPPTWSFVFQPPEILTISEVDVHFLLPYCFVSSVYIHTVFWKERKLKWNMIDECLLCAIRDRYKPKKISKLNKFW